MNYINSFAQKKTVKPKFSARMATGLTASVLAGLMMSACSDRSENETVTQVETSSTVVEATPTQDPMIDSTASNSGATAGVESGMAADTTDAMAGTAPAQPQAAEHKIIPKRHAKHVKKMKKTKTSSRVERTENVGATSPIYDRSDVVVAPVLTDESADESISGTTTGAGEISAPIEAAPVRAPGRFASANTDWGVTYEFNNAAAASVP